MDRQYLKMIYKKKETVQPKEISEEDHDPLSFALRQVLEGLVDLICPTEVIKFLTTQKAAKINAMDFKPNEIKPQY